MVYGVFSDSPDPARGYKVIAGYPEQIQAELFAMGASHDGRTWAVESFDGSWRTIVTAFRNGSRTEWAQPCSAR